MMNILKKSIISISFCCSLILFATGCDELEPPDTIEGILNIPSPQQETVITETEKNISDEEDDMTEYQSIFFQLESETETTQLSTQPITTMVTTTTIADTTVMTIPTTETVTEIISNDKSNWEQAYRNFLEYADYEKKFPEDSNKQDVKFLLLYLNEDDVPELFIQTTSKVYFYTVHNQKVIYAGSFPVSHYTYDFYYRPYQNCICTLQGSVMGDGTYLNVWEYETSTSEKSGLALKTEYCYPTREYSYEVYSGMGMNIDLEKAPMLDIHMDRGRNLGSSWFTVPDVLDLDTNIYRYEITEENLNAVFGEQEESEDEEDKKE
ncbi:MAG: hypothetical protein K2K06_01670 [Oscillospiraceae bacterium]|nr:hypothetical protein [Oscillospiraceae bacterium]